MALVGNIKGPKGDKGDKGDKGSPGEPLSVPPEGYYRVVNLYVNPTNKKLVYVYDDET